MTDEGVRNLIMAYAAAVSTGSLLISLLALATSIWVARRDRAKLAISFGRADFHQGPIVVDNLLQFEAANRGRRPVIVNRFVFTLSNSREWLLIGSDLWPLPKKLEEGDSYTNFVWLRAIQEGVQKAPSGVRITSLEARTSDGRVYRCRLWPWSPWHKIFRGPLAPEPRNWHWLDPNAKLREFLRDNPPPSIAL